MTELQAAFFDGKVQSLCTELNASRNAFRPFSVSTYPPHLETWLILRTIRLKRLYSSAIFARSTRMPYSQCDHK